MPDGPLERAQEGLCGADGEQQVIRCRGPPNTDSHGSLDQTTRAAKKEYDAATTEERLRCSPLLRSKENIMMSLRQELNVLDWLSACYRFLHDYKAALAHKQRRSS
jgi:hypothetical protein